MWPFLRHAIPFVLMAQLIAAVACAEKPRVIVSTDIGGSDNDDFQSLVHFLVYADLFDVEGLIASPPGAGGKSHIEEVLTAYNADYNTLQTYGDYPTYAALLGVTRQGATAAGGPGSGKSTEGSNLIVTAANKNDPRPLWILTWGSLTDVAQALYDAPHITAKIRLYSIAGAYNLRHDVASHDYIFNTHADLWWIQSTATYRGMYLGGNHKGDLDRTVFVSTHVQGHGALGALYYLKMNTLKMGDTPSVLYLLSPLVGGVGNWDDPTGDSWGGRFQNPGHGPRYWTDITGDYTIDRVHVNIWREQFLRDWQARMDRCLVPNPDAPLAEPTEPLNTLPVVVIDPPATATVVSGTPLTFTGEATDADDGDVTDSLVWSSNLDGGLGTGGTVTVTLSVGTHIIAAVVTDSGGLIDADSLTVMVTNPASAPASTGQSPLLVTCVKYVSNTARLQVIGKGTPKSLITVYHGANVGGPVLGTQTVKADSGFSVKPGPIPEPGTITVAASTGDVLANLPVRTSCQ